MNFAASFDWHVVLVVLVVATAGKVVGCGLSALWSGWSAREAGAIGFAMNARGAMEIVFGLLGYRYGIISEPMFVALVVMAIVTSLISAPAMQWLLRPKPASGREHGRAARSAVLGSRDDQPMAHRPTPRVYEGDAARTRATVQAPPSAR